jgi:hypothetical protein
MMSHTCRHWACAALAVLFLAPAFTPATAAPAPKVNVARLADLPVTIKTPYDPSADANADVAAAFAAARKNGKRVLIELGGNWCGDCIVLANVMNLPAVAPFIARHYNVVHVDVGRFNRNLQIPARFGFTKRLEGVPMVLIADKNGKLLNRNNTFVFIDARSMKPQAIVDWLARWAR